MIYAKINLRHGGAYIQPPDKLDVLVDEIQQGAECGAVGAFWTVELVEMEESEYEKLPEFAGH